MVITLIGMSGSGKTYWSKKLAKKGFIRYCCDDLIEKLLENELKKQGYSGITDVSKWMGQPYDKRYQKTSKMYLQKETQVMKKILKEISSPKKSKKPVVIDTTGSAIYTDSHILDFLSSKTTVVHLETPQSVQEQMFRVYLTDPKPVIWNGIYRKNNRESNKETLTRCYPLLLKTRDQIYRKLAHKTLDYFALHLDNYNVDRFLYDVTS